MTPFPSPLVRIPIPTGRRYATKVMKYVLNTEQEEWLRRWYPEVENPRIVKATGLTEGTLHRFARELGLRKSEAGMHRIMLRQGQRAKRTCEENGWYDSLRGSPPPPQSREATRRRWQLVREGKLESPMEIFKRTRPADYRKDMQRRSEQRKELIRKEKWRVRFGLTRQTRLWMVVERPYTRSQRDHRYSALKRGYVLMADCSEQGGERYNIYYDKDTVRNERFERNLVKDGFKVKEWKD